MAPKGGLSMSGVLLRLEYFEKPVSLNLEVFDEELNYYWVINYL